MFFSGWTTPHRTPSTTIRRSSATRQGVWSFTRTTRIISSAFVVASLVVHAVSWGSRHFVVWFDWISISCFILNSLLIRGLYLYFSEDNGSFTSSCTSVDQVLKNNYLRGTNKNLHHGSVHFIKCKVHWLKHVLQRSVHYTSEIIANTHYRLCDSSVVSGGGVDLGLHSHLLCCKKLISRIPLPIPPPLPLSLLPPLCADVTISCIVTLDVSVGTHSKLSSLQHPPQRVNVTH